MAGLIIKAFMTYWLYRGICCARTASGRNMNNMTQIVDFDIFLVVGFSTQLLFKGYFNMVTFPVIGGVPFCNSMIK